MSKQTENMSLRSVVPTKEVEILDQPENKNFAERKAIILDKRG